MNPKKQYVLVVLMVLMVGLLYNIVIYKYREYQVNSYMATVEADIENIKAQTNEKKERLAYVKTRAFLDKSIKLSQNKKNPGEDVVYLVSEEDMKTAKKTQEILTQDAAPVSEHESRTLGLSNPEKWAYYLFGGYAKHDD